MRHVFINELIKESKKDKNIYLITADLGFRAFETFQKEFPDRFINLGVAENNMIGVGAGMALQGKKVFVFNKMETVFFFLEKVIIQLGNFIPLFPFSFAISFLLSLYLFSFFPLLL